MWAITETSPTVSSNEASNGAAELRTASRTSASICRSLSGALREATASAPGDAIDCLLEDELLEFQAGRCSEAQLARLDAHLDGCASCRDLVLHLLGREAWDDAGDQTDGNAWLTTFMTGSLVASRYLIRRFVGKGGMGEVYEAFDRLMGMRVALKTVICTVSDRPNAVHKLMDEVKNALRVGHPNVCRINELQEHHDELHPGAAVPFFTMEFVDGERLGRRLEHGPLPLADTRVIAYQLLDGLRAAHARGVLHLDLKSDNVMLRFGFTPPEVVIMDFGLSRRLDRPAPQPSDQRQPGDPDERPASDERQELAGTLPYMSVEQLESRPGLGPPTDVYSFGVVLFEMLTGCLPFVATTSGAMLLEQLERRPLPPSHYAPGLSPELDRFVLRCLDSDPSARFADAGAALDALESIEWQPQREPLVRRWHWLACAAAGGLALAALLDALTLRDIEPASRPLAGDLGAAAASVGSAESRVARGPLARGQLAKEQIAPRLSARPRALEVSPDEASASGRRPTALPMPEVWLRSRAADGQSSTGERAEPAPAASRDALRAGESPADPSSSAEGQRAASVGAGAVANDAAGPSSKPTSASPSTVPRRGASLPPGGSEPARAAPPSPQREPTRSPDGTTDWTPRALPRTLLVPTRNAEKL